MTERQAREKNLEFTGCYERTHERIDENLERLRKEYPKCKFYKVTVPDNPLSRGIVSRGYSIYASRLYSVMKSIKQLQNATSFHDQRIEAIEEEYHNKLAEENARHSRDTDYLNQLIRERDTLCH